MNETTENVVVFRVEGRTLTSWSRDTLAAVRTFCRRPCGLAKRTDSFVGVDGWGHGDIVAATPDYSNWIGRSIREFRSVLH